MAVRVLLVEDDVGIRGSLKLALEDEGYAVDEAPTAEDALDLVGRLPPDVALVDLMLPGMDGFELCREVRKTSDLPIVVVTARSDTHDVVAGLEAGADDYVTKPFQVKELTARIRALLRRVRPGDAGVDRYVFDDLEIQPGAGLVRRNGAELSLTRTEFRLLCDLAQHAGSVLSREQLLERVWDYDYFGDTRLVDAHIRRLRTKVERDPSEPKVIVTVRGFGYKIPR